MTSSASERGGRPRPAAVRAILLLLPAAVLAAYLGLAVHSSRWMSITFDEPGHLVAGIAMVQEGDFRFGPNHPPLIRYWFTLPDALFGSNVALPTGDDAYVDGKQHSLVKAFLNRFDSLAMLRWSRFMVILLAVATGATVWWSSRRLFGAAAATAALLLFALEPNLMAHGSLATTDVGVTLFFLLACLALRQVCLRITAGSVLAFAALFAAAQLAKFSALVLWPASGAVLLIRALAGGPWTVGAGRRGRPLEGWAPRTAAAAGILAVVALVFLAATWGAYQFRYSMAPNGGLTIDSTEDREFGVNDRIMGRTLGTIRFLPEAYVRGFAQLLTWPQDRYFFAGKLRTEPTVWFFPVVLLVKTPTALLLLAGLGAWLALRRREDRPTGWYALAIPPLLYFLSAIASGQTTGIRHLLPLFPFLLLAAGLGSSHLAGRRAGRIALAALALLTVAEFSLAYPDTIAAFNLPSGGPSHGDRWLVDSNMDYGQGMFALKEWLDDHGIRQINMAIHTNLHLPFDRYSVSELPGQTNRSGAIGMPLLPGYVAISASVMSGYTAGQAVADFYAPLRRMKPVATIGHSIRVYRVDGPWWEGAP